MTSITIYGMIVPAVHKAGLTLPATLTERMSHLATVAESDLGTIRNSTTADLVAVTAKALDAGRDPFTDKAVIAALARHQLVSAAMWQNELKAWQEGQATAALAQHADSLLSEWAALTGRAGADLAKALTHLDRTSTLEAQAATALRAGGERGEAWRTAARALEVIDHLCDAWRYLATMALNLTSYNPERDGALLRNPHLTAAQLASIPRRTGTWELATQHDVTVTGATLDEYRAAISRVAGEVQEAADFDGNAQARQAWAKSRTVAVRLR